MHSIKSRFVVVVLVAVALSVAVLGVISIYTVMQKSNEDSEIILAHVCEKEARGIDDRMKQVAYSTSIIAATLDDPITSLKQFSDDAAFRAAYTKEARDLMGNAARDTPGVISYYYRYNNDIVEGDRGFLYSRASTNQPFAEHPLTEIDDYDPDDVEHVGWYYLPMQNEAPMWMEPYFNKNLDAHMISYVVPVFVNGDFIGVIGVDLDFSSIMDEVANIHPYEDSYAFLSSDDGMVYYHPTLPYGTMLFEDNDEESEVDEAIREGTSGEEAIVYNYRGVDKRLVVRTLENSMRLTVSIDAAEVYADRNMLIRRLAIASILIIVLSAVLSLFVIRRSLKPLTDLAASARKVADGDLDVQILSSDTAELSDLISSYQRTVAHLKEQMAFINELARHDGLTGLLNKSSEERALRLLDRDIEGGTARFSLAVFDVNNLKDMNDTYGHESGDLYLKSAANAIREAFEGHSTFRIGGDEFAAFVQVASDSDEKAEDVMNRCVARLDEIMESTNEKAEQAWERVELACGTAAFDPNTDTSASQVLARADEHMYANKRQMKRENHSEH